MRKIAAALAIALVAALTLGPPAQAEQPGFSTSYQRIQGAGGIQLGAVVLTPTGQGNGPFPLVVMPSSWGAPNLEYVGQGAKLAKSGFQVISYTSRGLWDSEGGLDIAGPPTVADVSKVIDWAALHTPADTSKVAAVGISYDDVVQLLEDEGVEKFAAAWNELLDSTKAELERLAPSEA